MSIRRSINVLSERFSRCPDNVPPRYYRFFVFGNYFYAFDIFAHVTAIVLNLFYGVYGVALFNVGSVLTYIVALYFNLRGRLLLSLALLLSETVAYVTMQSLVTGNIGINPVLLLMVMIVFFSPIERLAAKIGLGLAISVVYASLEFQVRYYAPLVSLPSTAMHVINLVVSFIVALIAAYVAYFFGVGATTAEAALERERRASESLLLNILPRATAARLKSGADLIADRYQAVTILFADIAGFTPLSEQMTPENLVNLLNLIFSKFDDLAERYGLEKIKTIGDAYMAVSGLPEPRQRHAQPVAEMALEMMKAMESIDDDHGLPIQLRIGIHSGPVVAGVIGKKKFAYDLWGDTVNTASRMASHGLPGKIQVSSSTYDLLKDQYYFDERGPIVVKGKGSMAAFLLSGKRARKVPKPGCPTLTQS